MASEDFTALSKLVVGLGRKKLGEFGGREKQGKIRGWRMDLSCSGTLWHANAMEPSGSHCYAVTVVLMYTKILSPLFPPIPPSFIHELIPVL